MQTHRFAKFAASAAIAALLAGNLLGQASLVSAMEATENASQFNPVQTVRLSDKASVTVPALLQTAKSTQTEVEHQKTEAEHAAEIENETEAEHDTEVEHETEVEDHQQSGDNQQTDDHQQAGNDHQSDNHTESQHGGGHH